MAIAYVQTVSGSVASGSTATITVGAGSIIIVACKATTLATSFTISDSQGSYTQLSPPGVLNNGTYGSEVAYLLNANAGAHVITLTANTGGTVRYAITEYSGVASVSAVAGSAGQYQSAPGTGAGAVTSGTYNSGSGNTVVGHALCTNQVDSTLSAYSGTIRFNQAVSSIMQVAIEDQVSIGAGDASKFTSTGNRPYFTYSMSLVPAAVAVDQIWQWDSSDLAVECTEAADTIEADVSVWDYYCDSFIHNRDDATPMALPEEQLPEQPEVYDEPDQENYPAFEWYATAPPLFFPDNPDPPLPAPPEYSEEWDDEDHAFFDVPLTAYVETGGYGFSSEQEEDFLADEDYFFSDAPAPDGGDAVPPSNEQEEDYLADEDFAFFDAPLSSDFVLDTGGYSNENSDNQLAEDEDGVVVDFVDNPIPPDAVPETGGYWNELSDNQLAEDEDEGVSGFELGPTPDDFLFSAPSAYRRIRSQVADRSLAALNFAVEQRRKLLDYFSDDDDDDLLLL